MIYVLLRVCVSECEREGGKKSVWECERDIKRVCEYEREKILFFKGKKRE